MDRQIIAVVIQEGSKFISELVRNRSPKRKEAPPAESQETPKDGKETGVEVACIPCAMGHFSACGKMLSEGIEIAKKEGMGSNEVTDRVNSCFSRLMRMEQADLKLDMITVLPEWERKLANRTLAESRSIRKNLKELSSVEDLEEATASTQTVKQEISKEWFREKLSRMPKEEKAKLAEKALEKLGEE